MFRNVIKSFNEIKGLFQCRTCRKFNERMSNAGEKGEYLEKIRRPRDFYSCSNHLNLETLLPLSIQLYTPAVHNNPPPIHISTFIILPPFPTFPHYPTFPPSILLFLILAYFSSSYHTFPSLLILLIFLLSKVSSFYLTFPPFIILFLLLSYFYPPSI